MSKIFISYRREDSQYVTDSLHDHLSRYFGEENIFLDVASIPFGVDFRQYLADQIAAHDVILVVMGNDWARIMQERSNQSNDFVRIEVESALEQNKLVIPVLVKEATMPNFADLPPSIEALQWLNSAIIRRKPDLEDDCRRLAEGIQQYFGVDMTNSKKQLSSQQSFDASNKKLVSNSQFTLPEPFEWVNIPAGRVILNDIRDGYLTEETTFEVSAFQIGKYPITYSQYELFVNGSGYQNPDYWTQVGWDWKEDKTEPILWKSEKWHIGDHPVIGVSWYESYAFTQWLAAQTGDTILLPTEKQWQRAAQGDSKRKYPWGTKFDTSHCNTSESNIGKTTPVTQYPKGASLYGVLDMSGNVREWCLTDFETGMNEVSNANKRTVRGGSWGNNLRSAAVTIRSRFEPTSRNFNIGFRCVRLLD